MAEGKRIPWKRLWTLAEPELPMLGIALFALFVSATLSLVYPQAFKSIVDAMVTDGDSRNLDVGIAALITTFLVQSLFSGIRAWLFTMAGERIVARLRGELFGALLGQDVAFFDTTRTGELTNRLSSDTAVLQNTVAANVSMALRFGAQAVGGAVMLTYTSPRLTLLALAVVPFAAVGGALYGRMLRTQSKDVQDALASTSEVAEETLSNMRTVRAFAQERFEVKRYKKAVDKSYQLAATRAAMFGAMNGVGGFVGYLTVALVVWYGGRLVLQDRMTVGDLTAFMLYTAFVGVSIGALAGLWSDFMKAVGASERVFELLDKVPELESSGTRDIGQVQGHVQFDAVQFAYPARPDAPVLNGLSVEVPPGRVLAIVGHSGAGKSTMAALLMRLYDPQGGAIRVDGIDLREVAPSSLRDQIGMVSQEPSLFATSIIENIRYGRPNATYDEVRAAAKAANADDFIMAFPDAYKTLVGERGVQLSGGQKQRVAIARALLKNPPILVLDEATSALDAESEHLVQQALERLMEGRTTLIIAHRLSTVKKAGRVIVVDGGRVAEAGTHEELVAKDGLYKKLIQHQFAA